MGIFVPEDQFYNDYDRQVGFNRYKQLIGRNWSDWILLNLLTLLGVIPLAIGILLSLMLSSVLLLIPCSFFGGMIFGPFLAGLFDNMLRCMRDDPLPWFANYKKAWKQNWKDSLIPGALLGLTIGIFCFILFLFWNAQLPPGIMTIVFLAISAIVLTVVFQLYFTQLVLFQQPVFVRLRNVLLFFLLHFFRCLGTGFLQLAYWGIYLLFAPWTLLILPFIGIWYIIFLSEFIFYDKLDAAFGIEDLINAI